MPTSPSRQPSSTAKPSRLRPVSNYSTPERRPPAPLQTNSASNDQPEYLQVKRWHVDGFSIDLANREELLHYVQWSIHQTVPTGQVLNYLNIHVLHLAQRHSRLKAALQAASARYCDSDGIRLLLQGSKSENLELAKLTAAGFYRDVLACLNQKRGRLFLLGSKEKTVLAAKQYVQTHFPKIEVVGAQNGFFTDEQESRVVQAIADQQPHLLIVGLSSPRQELWLARNRHRLNCHLMWSVGSLFHYLSKEEPRAPRWMLQANMEWLYRFMLRPRVLWKRVAVEIPWFFLRQLFSRQSFTP